MKIILKTVLSLLMVISLAGCGGKPSDAEIKAALEDGRMAIEDAKSKGWIDDDWIKENIKTVEAGSKIHVFDEFDTTYLDGTPASSSLISGKMCLVFFNTDEEGAIEKLKEYEKISEEMDKIGVPVLGIITDQNMEAAKDKLMDITFPIIVYNEEMQASLENYSEMIDGGLISVFTKDGGFYSTWNRKAEKDYLLNFAKDLADEKI